MNFTGFNLNYQPMNHVDEHGSVIEDDAHHTLAQGWLQTFSQVNDILKGTWTNQNVKVLGVLEQNVNQTPYQLGVFFLFETNQATQDIALNGKFCGALDLIRGTTLVQKIIVNGNNLNLPNVLAGDIVTGVLIPKK